MLTGRAFHLATRPTGRFAASDLAMVDVVVRTPREGEVVVRNAYLSIDPYNRAMMGALNGSVDLTGIGGPLHGGAVGQVIESRHPNLAAGSWVVHDHGWREYAVSDGADFTLVDAALAPVSTALGVLGMPGLTAYVGMLDIGRPQPNETVYVSGAAGAVGSVAGQIAKLRGCRVIGSAGTPEKVAWLHEIGFDDAFDYRATDPRDALRDGIDVCFDNVGGSTLEAAIGAMRRRGRIVCCGSIAELDSDVPPAGPRNLVLFVRRQLRMEGFDVWDYDSWKPTFLAEMASWMQDGHVHYRETIVEGFENAPSALIGLLNGASTGKMLVKI